MKICDIQDNTNLSEILSIYLTVMTFNSILFGKVVF